MDARYEKWFGYIGIGAIVLLLLGLGGWFIFIARQTTEIGDASAARGFAVGIPSFAGSRGSTIENIARGIDPSEQGEMATTSEKRAPRLWRISQTPVAGAGFIQNGSSTLVRFVERSTGHVFDADPESGTVMRRTNTRIPEIYEATIGSSMILLRSLDEGGGVRTLAGTLGTTTENGFLPITTIDIGITGDILVTDESLTFIAQTPRGGSIVRLQNDETTPDEVAAIGIERATLLTLNGRVAFVEPAASGVLGNAYAITGTTLTPIARATPGLTVATHPSRDASLIGSDTGSSLHLSLQNGDANRLPLSLATVAEKCVWSPGSALRAFCATPRENPGVNFLDNWYRGRVHTRDVWYSVDAGKGTAEVFFEMGDEKEIDVERPQIDASSSFILFQNMRDKSLWLLRILE